MVCVLSHGEKGCVFGSDGQEVSLRELTEPFTSKRARTLAGKPKLFFIQACQGSGYQGGSLPCPPTPTREEEVQQSPLEEDAGPIRGETVPWGADFLLGMATVPECKSFRNTNTGSIYIQELCRQLIKSAERWESPPHKVKDEGFWLSFDFDLHVYFKTVFIYVIYEHF